MLTLQLELSRTPFIHAKTWTSRIFLESHAIRVRLIQMECPFRGTSRQRAVQFLYGQFRAYL